MYSHDPKVIRDARLAYVNNWKLGPKALLSNFNVVSANFPRETSPSDPDGYSQSARDEVYHYVDDLATNGPESL